MTAQGLDDRLEHQGGEHRRVAGRPGHERTLLIRGSLVRAQVGEPLLRQARTLPQFA
jgi:hypothetical protein